MDLSLFSGDSEDCLIADDFLQPTPLPGGCMWLESKCG